MMVHRRRADSKVMMIVFCLFLLLLELELELFQLWSGRGAGNGARSGRTPQYMELNSALAASVRYVEQWPHGIR